MDKGKLIFENYINIL